MNILINILRFVFGITFIVSGFLKMSDPVGTQLIVTEYLRAAHMDFFSFLSLYAGIFLSMLEFIIGLSVLSGIRYRLFTWVGLVITSFFTVLTLILALFDPIKDCGCFGEAVHLSNWQTFYKNVVLMVCILVIFLTRKKHQNLAPEPYEWSMTGVFSVLILSYGVYNLYNAPILDFGNFKVGTDIESRLLQSSENVEYETILVYSKDGKTETFTMDNLPDDSWTFVDAQTRPANGNAEADIFDFMVTDLSSADITGKVLEVGRKVVLLTYTALDRVSENDLERIETLYNEIKPEANLFVLTSSAPETALKLSAEKTLPESIWAFADYKTVISVNRSNGGLVYLDDGVVVSKLSENQINMTSVRKLLEADSDDLIIRDSIMQRLFYEIAIISLLFLLWIMKLVCRAVFVRKFINSIPTEKNEPVSDGTN